MYIAVPHHRAGGLATSGIALGILAAGRVLVRRLLKSSLVAGEVVQRRMLGTEARYRVLADAAETVEVEVLVAPGLEPGMHVRLSADAANASSRLAAPGVPRGFRRPGPAPARIAV